MEDKLKIEQFSQLWEAKHQIFAHKFFKIAKTQFSIILMKHVKCSMIGPGTGQRINFITGICIQNI